MKSGIFEACANITFNGHKKFLTLTTLDAYDDS